MRRPAAGSRLGEDSPGELAEESEKNQNDCRNRNEVRNSVRREWRERHKGLTITPVAGCYRGEESEKEEKRFKQKGETPPSSIATTSGISINAALGGGRSKRDSGHRGKAQKTYVAADLSMMVSKDCLYCAIQNEHALITKKQSAFLMN